MTQGPSEVLHSVKWYRINHLGNMQEFYSFKPNKNPPASKHHLKGVKVDMRYSNVRQVLLRKVGLATSGRYRCEVTTRSLLHQPRFDSQFQEGRLVVLELPEEGPVISGGLPSYQLNDQLELNCTSARTYPPTVLKWFLNGRAVDSSQVYPIKKGAKNGLFRSQISLNVTVTRTLFNYGRIRIKCVAGVQDDLLLQGNSLGSSHRVIETILLPEALKKERTGVFVVPMASGGENLSSSCLVGISLLLLIFKPMMTSSTSPFIASDVIGLRRFDLL